MSNDPINYSIDNHLEDEARMEDISDKKVGKLQELIEANDRRIIQYLSERFFDAVSNPYTEDNVEALSIFCDAFVLFYLSNPSLNSCQQIVSDEELINHLGL